jgi:ATP-binding cassette subfamily C protein
MKKYLFKFKGLLLLTICLTIICAALEVCIAFVLSDIVDVSLSKDMQLFKNSMFIAIVYLLITASVNLIHKIIKALYLKKTLVALKGDIFSKILSKDMCNFTNENTANYISTLTNDEAIIEQDYFNNILQITYYSVSFMVAMYSLIKVNYNLIIAIFLGGALTLFVPQLLGGKLSDLRSIYSNNMAKYTSKLKDMFSGFEVIRSFNVVDKVVEDFNTINQTTESSKYKFNIISSAVDMLSGLFGSMLHISVMMVGVYLTIKGKITVGEMIAAVQLMNYIINPLVQCVMTINKIKSTKVIASKMLEIIKAPQDSNALTPKFDFENKISFSNVLFSYNNESTVLDNVSLSFEKGKRYAVVGSSGSGKSTLLKLLLGYYKNYTGEIKIDDLELKSIKQDSVYELMCAIQQNVYLFEGTIKDNITLYKNYSEEEINEAVKLSELEKLIASLPNGLDTMVGENGSNLSGGERQRVSIARAVIKRAPIILLDEATSALDIETGTAIEKTILSLEESTPIVITHKLNKDILVKYDEIIVMKGGRIVEQGNFYELLSNKKFLYSMLEVEEAKEAS